MTASAESQSHQGEKAASGRWALASVALLAALATIRLTLLFTSNLELYPDEAQYWAWSRHLEWGYFSKPPMIAWLIRAATAIGGDSEPWVRLPALVCQTAAGAFAYLAARRLWGDRAGFWAAALYALAPGVALSSRVASTDAPLMMFLAAAVWAYAGLLRGAGPRAAATVGLCLGLAMLSKYAALYAVAAVALHAVVSRAARASWSWTGLAAAVAAATVVLAPNLIWNATHGFETVSHTAANANWRAGDLFNPGEVVDFIGAQFGVFGPVALMLLAIAIVEVARRSQRGDAAADSGLALLTGLPLLIVSVQALLSRANANWAAAFVPPGAVLLGGRVAQWLHTGARNPRWAGVAVVFALGSQMIAEAVLSAALVSPPLATAMRLDNGLKRARGWASTAAVIRRRVLVEQGRARLTALAVDDRFVFYALTYYGRDWLNAPGAPPLTAWVREASPQNEAEATRPLTAVLGARVLGISAVPEFRDEFLSAFARADGVSEVAVSLDPRRTRDLSLFVGTAYGARPAITLRPTTP